MPPSANPSNKSEANIPSAALMELLSPDGYYTYLGIEKKTAPATTTDPTASPSSSLIDEELVKKNYRRLSLKHHPDRPGGDAETFHALNRAHTVLMNTKLREQYDLLGLDLDEEHDEEHKGESDGGKADKPSDQAEGPTAADSIVSTIFTAALTAILQLAVRTVMMGVVAVIVTRYRLTVYPALTILAFIAYRLHTIAQANHPTAASNKDLFSPALIGAGLMLMHLGRDFPDKTWSFMFWIGEALVMTMFTYNSLPPPASSPAIAIIVGVVSLVLTLILRGNVWRYATVVGLEAFLAIVIALAFPLMEMVLEEIVKEKLRKVGDKVREHSKRVQVYYANQKR